MELRQLVYFEAVVSCGGFTHAGRHLHVAQPAISAQIRRLEAELGTPLLYRTSRRIALTTAGEIFLARTRRVLAELDQARAELDGLANVTRGRVRIGATPVLGGVDLQSAMAHFHRAHPHVSMSLRTDLVSRLCAALDADELDLVLGPLDPGLEGYAVTTLSDERLVLVTPATGALPERIRTLAEVRRERFICLPRESGLYTLLTKTAADHDFAANIAFEASSPTTVRELVSAGLGVALMAESAALAPGPPISIHHLDDGPAPLPVGAILPTKRPVPPVAIAFLTEVMAQSRVPEPGVEPRG